MLIGNKKKSMEILANEKNLRDYQNQLRGMCLKILKEKRNIIEDPVYYEHQNRWNKVKFINY